jgi:Transcriptional regulatory protein, C terminal
MHTWFDEQNLEPRSLQYRISNDAIEVQVDFALRMDARRFARTFGGSVFREGRDPSISSVRTHLRRRVESKPPDLAECAVDWDLATFIVGGERRPVPRQVWLVFTTLARNAGRLVTREQVCNALYGDDPGGGPLMTDRIINVRMYQLRRACPWQIRTVHAVGFVLEGFKPECPVSPANAAVGVTRAQLMARR